MKGRYTVKLEWFKNRHIPSGTGPRRKPAIAEKSKSV
jgi:hypothetical protein